MGGRCFTPNAHSEEAGSNPAPLSSGLPIGRDDFLSYSGHRSVKGGPLLVDGALHAEH